MLMDLQNLFSDAQSLVQAAGTYVSTNIIDLLVTGTIPGLGGQPIADKGRARRVQLFAQILTAVTSGGAATLQVQVCSSANNDLSTPTILCQTDVIAKATLVQGYQFRLPMIPFIAQRYLGLQYVIGTAAITAGTVTAGLVEAAQTNPFVG